MEPRIETIPEKKLIGKRIRTSLSNNGTFKLWQSFMPHRHQITDNIGPDLISMQIYDSLVDTNNFNPAIEFEKWAAIEVHSFNIVPDGMETYTLKAGLYAVFIHQGAANDFTKTFQHIFGTWLPASLYNLDDRPHFEVMGAKYKGNDPTSEEEIWIPIKTKQ